MVERISNLTQPPTTRIGRLLSVVRDPVTAGLDAADRLRARIDAERQLSAESDGRDIDITDLTDNDLWPEDPGLKRYADALPAKTPVAQSPQAHQSSHMPSSSHAEETWRLFENGDPQIVTNLLPKMARDASPVVIRGAKPAGELVARGDTTSIDDSWDQFVQSPVVHPSPVTRVARQADTPVDLGIPNTGLLKAWRDHRTKTQERRRADNRNVGWDVAPARRERIRQEPQVPIMDPVQSDEDAREARIAAIQARRKPVVEPNPVPTAREAAKTEPIAIIEPDNQQPIEATVIPLKKVEKKTSQTSRKNHSLKYDPKRGEAPVLHGMTMHDALIILNREIGTGPQQQQIRREMHAFVMRAGELSERRALKWFDENSARNMYLSMLDHIVEPTEQSFHTKAQLEAYEKIRSQLTSYFQKAGKRSWDSVMPPSQIEDMAKFLHGYFGGYYDQQLGGMTKRGARNEFFTAAVAAYKSAQQIDLMTAAA